MLIIYFTEINIQIFINPSFDSVSKGVNVSIEDNQISIDFHIIVAYGVSISVVADNLMSTVRYKIEEFTGMPVKHINIFVEGVRVMD